MTAASVHRRLRRRVGIGMLVGLVAFAGPSAAEHPASRLRAADAAALDLLFAEQHAESAALDVHRRAMTVDIEARYELLRKWVMPSADHRSLRLYYDFTPTYPAPPVRIAANDLAATGDRQDARLAGGELIAPAFDLIDAARQLGRLEELRREVDDLAIGGNSPDVAAFETLLAIAAGDSPRAAESLQRLLTLTEQNRSGQSPPSAAELLVFDRAVDAEELREPISSELMKYLPWLRAEYHRDALRMQFAAIMGRLQAWHRTALGEATVALDEAPLRWWQPGSRQTAQSRGAGNPPPRWEYRPGHAENTIGHDEDYLYFAAPLTGNYEVECDVRDFDWRESHLLVAGAWVAPVYTWAAIDVGYYSRSLPRIPLDPPLTKGRDWIHYRAVVRDGTVTTYFNGREVHRRTLLPDADPWLAVRSSPRHDSGIRNLRISGDPIIPETIPLSEARALDNWYAYDQSPPAAARSTWQLVFTRETGMMLYGRALNPAAEPPPIEDPLLGVQESLLRYHRPMFEDGTIEYEFRYLPNELHVHPALDRLALLLDPGGVRVHWITDGESDRTGLSPANVIAEEEHRRGPERLPLKPNEWNHIRLTLQGDTLTLALNGQEIYERPVDPGNRRVFGLFHYADRTEAQVRHVRWRGDWPRELPPLLDQDLVLEEAEFLDRDTSHMTDEFHHDFAADGFPPTKFSTIKGDLGIHLRAVPEGVWAHRNSTGDYRNVTFAPDLSVHGDFDITVTYDQFQAVPVPGGNGSVMLLLIFDNETSDEAILGRREFLRADGKIEQLVQCAEVRRLPEGERRNYFVSRPMEERSGRLRLARRGDQLYFLTAEGDSPHFRLRAQRECSTAPLQADGVRPMMQVHLAGGTATTVWKRVSLRAEQLSGRALGDVDQQLQELNRQRDALPHHFRHDFATAPPSPNEIYSWNQNSAWDGNDGGWAVVSQGTENWSSSGSTLLAQVDGDFDIATEFEVREFAETPPGKRSAVYLQIETPDEGRTQISLIYSQVHGGRREVIVQVRSPDGEGGHAYSAVGGRDMTEVTSLRFSRRGEKLLCLARSALQQQETVVAEIDIAPLPLMRSNVRFLVHTGAPDRQSHVLWKSFDVHAQQLTPNFGTSASRPRRGLIETLIDILK